MNKGYPVQRTRGAQICVTRLHMFTFYGFSQYKTKTRIFKYCKAFKLTLLFPKQYSEPKKASDSPCKDSFSVNAMSEDQYKYNVDIC